MPFPFIPLAIAGATTLISEYQRKQRERQFERSRPPKIDFGKRRSQIMGGIASQALDAQRGAGEMMAARGIDDPGSAFSQGRALTGDANRQMQAASADILAEQEAYQRALAEWERQKMQLPDFTNSLGSGIQAGISAYQLQGQPIQGPQSDFVDTSNLNMEPTPLDLQIPQIQPEVAPSDYIQTSGNGRGGLPMLSYGRPNQLQRRGQYVPQPRVQQRRPQLQLRPWSPTGWGD